MAILPLNLELPSPLGLSSLGVPWGVGDGGRFGGCLTVLVICFCCVAVGTSSPFIIKRYLPQTLPSLQDWNFWSVMTLERYLGADRPPQLPSTGFPPWPPRALGTEGADDPGWSCHLHGLSC